MNLGFSYSGDVKIKLLGKNKKVSAMRTLHNEGTTDLFKFFMQCLVGSYNASNKPAFIDMYTIPYSKYKDVKDFEKPDDYTSRMLRQRVSITSSVVSEMKLPDDSNIGWAVKFSTPIAYYDIDTGYINGSNQRAVERGMLVITSADGTVLARVYLGSYDMKNIRSITDGQQMLIEWIMYITNSSVKGAV